MRENSCQFRELWIEGCDMFQYIVATNCFNSGSNESELVLIGIYLQNLKELQAYLEGFKRFAPLDGTKLFMDC